MKIKSLMLLTGFALLLSSVSGFGSGNSSPSNKFPVELVDQIPVDHTAMLIESAPVAFCEPFIMVSAFDITSDAKQLDCSPFASSAVWKPYPLSADWPPGNNFQRISFNSRAEDLNQFHETAYTGLPVLSWQKRSS